MYEQYYNDPGYCQQRLSDTYLRLKERETLIFVESVGLSRGRIRLYSGDKSYTLDDVILAYPSLGYTAPTLFSGDYPNTPIAMYLGGGKWSPIESDLYEGNVENAFVNSIYIQASPLRQFRQGLSRNSLTSTLCSVDGQLSLSTYSQDLLASSVFKRYPKDIPQTFRGKPLASTCIPICRDILLLEKTVVIRGRPTDKSGTAINAFLRARFSKIVWGDYDENVRTLLASFNQ